MNNIFNNLGDILEKNKINSNDFIFKNSLDSENKINDGSLEKCLEKYSDLLIKKILLSCIWSRSWYYYIIYKEYN